MGKTTLGKNQTFSRVINNKLVTSLLQKENLSATDLAQRLKLSNATMSSILKELLESEVIKVSSTESIKGCGRKQVLYTLNENYGLCLCINVSNYQETITIVNMNQEVLEKESLEVEKYDTVTMYLILLRTTKLLMKEEYRNIPLRNIVISLPGRVNRLTGELVLSKQFDPELFKEQNFVSNIFKKQYPGVPVFIINDINVSASAELKKGVLTDIDNALYISIDMGIGGAMIINGKLFEGNQGYAGEFGLIKVSDGDRNDYLDEFVSFRVLIEQAESIAREEIHHSRSRLIELFHENDDIKKIVLHSAEILGKTLSNMIEVLDIPRVVIGGRAVGFGEEYLETVKSQMNSLIYKPDVSFASLGVDAKQIGAASIGVDYILAQAAEKEKVEG